MILFALSLFLVLCLLQENEATQAPPVISIMTQGYWGDMSKGYIGASYVKWVESAGARVVPIPMFEEPSDYESLFLKLNGLLFPGIDPKNHDYNSPEFNANVFPLSYRTAFEVARKLNEQGHYFPVWGTCLGFEMMMTEEAKPHDVLASCKAWDLPAPVNFPFLNMFKKDHNKGKMFQNLTKDQYETMKKKNVTIHYHNQCITKEGFNNSPLKDTYRLLDVSRDANGLEFVSIFEGIDKPYYGVQFHPEKPIFEYYTDNKHANIPHDSDIVHMGQYFANFFVDECRKSDHEFPDDMKSKLIYSHNATYTADYEYFEQMYFFSPSNDFNNSQ